MALGRRSRALTQRQIERFKAFQYRMNRTMPQMRLVMAAPFAWRTLQRAVDGKPVWELSHAFIVNWLDRFAPELPGKGASVDIMDGKMRAAGDDREPEEVVDPVAPARLRSEKGEA
jgi:hypothetical protein